MIWYLLCVGFSLVVLAIFALLALIWVANVVQRGVWSAEQEAMRRWQ